MERTKNGKKPPDSGHNSEEMGQDTVIRSMAEMREEEKSMIMLTGSQNSTYWCSKSKSLNRGCIP